jgi:hypothetical protein
MLEQRLGAEVHGSFQFAGTRCDTMVARVFGKLSAWPDNVKLEV